MKTTLLLSITFVSIGCGTKQIQFVADKKPAPSTLTLVEASRASSAYGGTTFVSAIVLDAQPALSVDVGLQFQHASFGVGDVTLGTFFPSSTYLTVPQDPRGLLQWKIRQVDADWSELRVQILQDEQEGVEVSNPGQQSLFGVSFHCAEPFSQKSSVVFNSDSRVISKSSVTIDASVMRGGHLEME